MNGTLTLQQDKKFQMNTREDVSTDGRHAKVSLQITGKDSKEGFTINATYLDLKYLTRIMVRILKKKNKFIGNPQERIEEDYLRIIRFLRFSIQYKNFEKDKDTIKIIKKNIPGILKLSKERIFSEIVKITKLKNLSEVVSNNEFKEIFEIIFPEFKYLNRLSTSENRKHKKNIMLEYNLVLALLLIDQSDNHNYFVHKYKTSNFLKYLNFLHKYFYEAKKNRNFFLRI